MKQPYNTALYMRLSRDDENYGDSVSIETQRTILQQYAKEHGLSVYGEYVDDGWSGTNFERPSFQRMMDDVETGKVNCIITKDLSRFGREHVMMDYYLEFVFPEKQIRYIAVAENEDTEKGLSDFVPFKNLFNEWFAKDTSRKVKTALRAKFAAGERTFAYAPLGYIRHPEVKNTLAIDEETRWIIEKIFDLAFHGAGAAKITKTLIAEKVPTAGWLNYQRYGTFANIYANAPEEKSYAWTIAQVKSILQDETYIGNSVHNKQTNISYKNKKKVRKPKEEWIRVENTHEAIISWDVFEQVQKQIASRRRQQKDATTQIFAGLVKCADCGWSMRFGTNRQNKTPYSHFTCSQYGQMGTQCSAHYIREDVLRELVLERIQAVNAYIRSDVEGFQEEWLHYRRADQERDIREDQKRMEQAKKRLATLDVVMSRLYEDYALGEISKEKYKKMTSDYEAEQERLKLEIETTEEWVEQRQAMGDDLDAFIALTKKYVDVTELTQTIVNEYIRKIIIHAPDKSGGKRRQKVEIIFNFVDEVEIPVLAEPMIAESTLGRRKTA